MDRPLQYTLTLTLGLLALASCTDNNAPSEPVTEPDQPAFAELAATANRWTAKAVLPTGRVALAAAVVKNAQQQSILYAIGGDDGNGVTLSTVEAYDFAMNTWSTKAPLPVRLESTNGAGVIAGKIYVSGGRDLDNHSSGSDDGVPRSSLYVYDPLSDSWSRKADMPQPSMSGVTGVIGGKLYVLNASFGRFYRYDPSMDTWSVLPKCPGEHFGGGAAVINGKFYVAGGVRFATGGPIAIRKLHVYDPGTNTWSEKAPMPRAVSFAAGAQLLGQFYVLGGSSNDRGRDYVQAYDPVANTWTMKAPLPTFRTALAASNFVNVNGQQRIVAVGGYGGLGDRWIKSNDVYAP
jgi:N-acetylneuraminic acid mutarotase